MTDHQIYTARTHSQQEEGHYDIHYILFNLETVLNILLNKY